MAEKTETKNEDEREYIIPLRKGWKKVPRYKRANKAIKTIKEFLARHMKLYERDLNKIKIDQYLNEAVWFRGIKKPSSKIKVKVVKKGDIIQAELPELPEKIKFKKERIEKREKKGEEFVSKKKTKLIDRLKAPERTEEEKKEEKEKAMAGEEAMQKLGKEAAKTTKKMEKDKLKQPKHLQRKALAK
jgi:large subunit ribosomal protein L31e